MTAQDVHDLAVALHALLPTTTLAAAPWEPEQQYAVADQLTAACEAAGVTEILATVIAEALAGYLGHWAGRYGNLDDDVERAQQILTLALGLHTDSMGYTMREGDMTAAAIAQMLGRVLVVDLLADEEAP